MPTPKISSVVCHPNASISDTASGEYRNWPNEPAAVPAPKASERQRSGSSLPNAPSTTENEQPGKAEADEHAGREIEHPRRGRIRHQGETERIEQRRRRTARARCRSDRQSRRRTAGRPPQDVLDREREPEHVAAPAVVLRHRREEEAERRARTEAQQRDQQPHATITAGVRQPMLVTRGTEGDEMAMAEPV